MIYFKVIWDSWVWGWSLGILGLLALVLFSLLRASLFATPRHFGVAGIAATFILIVIVAALLFAPRGCVIDGKKLHVCTVMAKFTYDLSRLSEAHVATAGEVFSPGIWRLFGVGGLFGYYGYFKNPQLGKFLAFATDRNRLVVLRFPQKILVISPHDPQGFLQQVQQTLENR